MDSIGRYTVRRELGRGCMGVVYLAFDPSVKRSVAVKTIELPEGLDDNTRVEFRERFLREAQAAGNLSHPTIVTIHDVGEDPNSGKPFIVMEYVEGGSLRESLRQSGPMDLSQVLGLGHAMAGALGAAHKAGIIHRDIKPANILLPAEGSPAKLADFGVARLDGSELTRSGSTIGSPSYMAPEQVAGRKVDGRSDLFSLAALMYEALTGQKPFQGEDIATVLYAVIHADPAPPSRLRPGLPSGVDRFFQKALAKNPEQRFQNAGQFREALDDRFRDDPVEVVEEAGEATVVDRTAPIEDLPKVTGLRGMRWRAALLVLPFLAVLWIVFDGGESTLAVKVRSAVEKGQLAVYVDGDEVWSTRLRAPLEDGKSKKLMRKWLRVGQEQFDTTIEVDSGEHTVSARLMDDGAGTRFEDSVVIDFEKQSVHGIKIIAGGPLGSELSLQKD